MTKDKSVFGSYASRKEVESAIGGFKDAGFSGSDISVILPDFNSSKSGPFKATPLQENSARRTEELIAEGSTKTPQGASIGMGTGAALGGALGWLVGIGALVIPGVGPVIALGPLVTALAGIGIGGALGGFAGSLIGLGISEAHATSYERNLSHGGILVAIHCQSSEEIQRAREIMEITGAEDISIPGETLPQRNNTAA